MFSILFLSRRIPRVAFFVSIGMKRSALRESFCVDLTEGVGFIAYFVVFVGKGFLRCPEFPRGGSTVSCLQATLWTPE